MKKEAKQKGHGAKMIYNKLDINGEEYSLKQMKEIEIIHKIIKIIRKKRKDQRKKANFDIVGLVETDTSKKKKKKGNLSGYVRG